MIAALITVLIADLSDVPVQRYGLDGTRDARRRDGEG